MSENVKIHGELLSGACSALFIGPVTHISDPKMLIPSALAEIKKIHHAAEGKRGDAIWGTYSLCYRN